MTNYAGDEKRKTAWHLSREVTVSTLIAIILASGAGISAYSDINSDIKVLKLDVESATKDRVRKDTLEQMMKNKDLQIESVKKDIVELKKQGDKIESKIDRQRELLLDIVKNMPRKPDS